MKVGIDLGSSTTIASCIDNYGMLKPVPDVNFRESLFTPSCVYLEGSKALVGRLAELYTESNPDKQDIRFFKRYFGKQTAIFKDETGRAWLPEAIAALVLKKMRYDTETSGMGKISSIVLTVPAHFNDMQRRSIIDAGRLAGMEAGGIIEEPVAASLAYYHGKKVSEEIMMVYDFGGGTFDISIIAANGRQMHVISKDGMNNIGGFEFDQIIFEDILTTMKRNWSIEADLIPSAWKQAIRNKAERIKILSASDSTREYHPYWIQYREELYEYVFRPEWFRQQAWTYLEKTEELIRRSLKSMNLDITMIDRILLTGGSTQLPFITGFMKQLFPVMAEKIVSHNPVFSVSEGAAIYASYLGDSGSLKAPIEFKGVSTYTIAIEEKPGHFDKLIFRNTPLPSQVKRVFPIAYFPGGLRVKLVQFWNENEELFDIGTIVISPEAMAGETQAVELVFDFRANGTTGIKAFGAASRRELSIAVKREKPQLEFDFNVQKKLVDSVVINNIPI